MSILGTFFALLTGWVGGALVNYLADVLPYHLKPVSPFCQHCQKAFPLWNYLVWPRRCPACGRRRAWRTWLVEAAAITAAFWLWNAPPPRLGFFLGLLLLVYFGAVAIIDLEHRLIMHSLSLAGVLLGAFTGVWLQWQKTHSPGAAILDTFLGGAAGFGVMLALYFLGGRFARWIARQRGETLEEEALGFGDVHLGLILGLFLGWPAVIIGLVVGVMFGGMASLAYLVIKVFTGRHQWFAAIPYGPYLIAGAVFLLYFREPIIASLGN